MKKSLCGVIAAFSLMPVPSIAGEAMLANLDSYGEIALHNLSGGGASENYWTGDFGVSLLPSEDKLPMGFGFYVGYEGLGYFGDSFDLGFPTAAMVVTSGAHQLSFGIPRSVISDTFDNDDRVGSLLFDFEADLIKDSVRYARLLGSMEDDGFTLYGVRYDTKWNNTSLSSGIFWGKFYPFDWEPASMEMRFFQAAVEHELGNISFRAALELGENLLDGRNSSYSAGATVRANNLTYGLDASFITMNEAELTYVDLFGTYQVNENLKTSITNLRIIEQGWNASITSIGVEFLPNRSSFLRFTTVFDHSVSWNTEVYEASIGVRF